MLPFFLKKATKSLENFQKNFRAPCKPQNPIITSPWVEAFAKGNLSKLAIRQHYPYHYTNRRGK